MHISLSSGVSLLGAALIIWSLSGLYFYDIGRKSVKPTVKTETKTEQKTQYIDRVITKTVKGDTITEVIHEKGKTETKLVEKEKLVKPELSRYAVSGYISFDPIDHKREWQAMAGARLGDLPVFAELGATSKKEILAGIRWEF